MGGNILILIDQNNNRSLVKRRIGESHKVRKGKNLLEANLLKMESPLV